MPRHIDADKLIKSLELSIKSWGRDSNSNAPNMVNAYKGILFEVGIILTADVVPREEVEGWRDLNNNLLEAGQEWQKRAEQLEYTLLGVMHSVDKWLDGEELKQDEVNRAATKRDKTLRIVEGYQAQIRATIDFYEKREKEIFDEIEAALAVHTLSDKSKDYADGAFDTLEWVDTKLAELKKKYTEGGTLIDNI